MHNINFINPLTKKIEYEIRRWIHFTLFISGIIITSGAIMIGLQWYLHQQLQKHYSDLKKQLTTYDSVMDTQRKTKQDQDLLKKKIAKLHRCHNNPKNPIAIIETVSLATKQSQIESLVIKNEQLELKIIAPNSAHAMLIIKTLQTSPLLKKVYLQSLQLNEQNQAITLIKAVISS